MRTLLIFAVSLLAAAAAPAAAADDPCPPTPPDAQGPFYREGAPVRSSIGKGYLLFGEVKSTADCQPVPGAKVELWTTGPDGRYDDRWRATLYAGPEGKYHFETHFPGRYGSRPPHIHILASAPGFRDLVTQHYPQPGRSMAEFDLVLIPRP